MNLYRLEMNLYEFENICKNFQKNFEDQDYPILNKLLQIRTNLFIYD